MVLPICRDLTEKGLKRLGSSIEISYSTIQQLVIKPLHTGILNICFHLNCVMGMSKNVYFYQVCYVIPSVPSRDDVEFVNGMMMGGGFQSAKLMRPSASAIKAFCAQSLVNKNVFVHNFSHYWAI